MRISPMPRVCFGLLCGLSILIAGCGSPSSQNLASLTITATPSAVPVGGAAILKAVAHLSDGTTQDVSSGTQWTLSNPALATMTDGALTAKAPGALTVQAAYVEVAPAGTSPASATVTPQSLSASAQVTITPDNGPGSINVPVISWTPPAAISYGTALSSTQLNATANVSGTFAYTPAAGTVLKASNQALFAIFTPTDTKTYSAATATVQLNVGKASPTITWNNPAPITAGTALGATQLDATASVPGSFMYSPVAGAVLTAGTQQLTAVFSPSDATDYSSATAHASLVVSGQSGPPTAPGPVPTPTPTPGPVPTGCGGPTINLNSSMSTSTLQSTIANAPSCALIIFGAGTYKITNTLTIPCHSLTITGPAATPATAEITTSSADISLFNMTGGCTSGTTTLEYLQLDSAGAFQTDGNSYSNINILHNQMTNIPSEFCGQGCNEPCPACQAVVFAFNNSNTSISNINIEYNSFGDANSCNAGINIPGSVPGPYLPAGCAGVLVNATGGGSIIHFNVKYNTFFHLEEGIHFPTENSFQPNTPNSTCDDCEIEYNFFSQIHRIQVEFQIGLNNDPTLIQYNVLTSPANTQANGGEYAFSLPCCQFGPSQGNQTNTYLVASNNLIYDPDPLTSQYGISWAYEAWGYGAQYNNNLIQGYICVGLEWGLVSTSTSVSNNTMQSPLLANNSPCPFYTSLNSGYIGQEFAGNANAQVPPTFAGNVYGATPTAVASVAPTISPAAGAQTFPLTVTLTDPGYASGAVPLANTGIWYTTDGSTPVPGSGTAQYVASGGSFVLSAPSTVKTVGMWGAPNQPTSYPAGYGFVPSNVVTAAYSASGAIKRPAGTANSSTSPTGKTVAAGAGVSSATLVSVAITPSKPVVAIGSTTQLKATATFEDGSVKDVTTEFSWQSADARTMTANGSGALAGVASGNATISGSYGGLQASVRADSTIGEVEWNDPIVITKGGTYTGNWQSTDAKTPAVAIATTAPVTIENSHVRSAGSLIKTSVAGSNLTVRNSVGVALNARIKGQPNGNFVDVVSPRRLDVENNYVENAQGGVIVHGYAGNRDGEHTLVIRANRARNLNGMLSDGNAGYLPADGTNRTEARFIQFDSVQSVPGIDVGWNEVINYPGQSLVEDNIDIYRSGGTANQPLEIHDTYIQGAYPYKAAQGAYTGGGIKTDAKAGDNAQEVPSFNSIHDNQVVSTTSYGIQFAAGHDNVAANNRVISSGLLADGSKIAAQHAGMANGDAGGADVANANMYNNAMHDNLIGWMCWQSSCAQAGYRKDQFFPAAPADYSTNSVVATRQITLDMENNEYQVWLNKMSASSVTVGPAF